MRTDRERAAALSAALTDAGEAEYGRAVRLATVRGLPVSVPGPHGESLLVRYAVSSAEGKAGSWVAERVRTDGSRALVATEDGPRGARKGSTERLELHSIRVDGRMWAELGRSGDRQELVREALEEKLRALGRWPPRD